LNTFKRKVYGETVSTKNKKGINPMARGLNKVMLIGNLGQDPEIKYSPSGTAIANLRIATTENKKGKDGSWEEQTEWHRVVMFGKTAETCKNYLHKGSKVYIEGRLQTRSWDDKDGQKKYMTEIVGFMLIMLDSKGGGAPQEQTAKRGADIRPPDDMPEGGDDLPF